jgi:hypothetical protein
MPVPVSLKVLGYFINNMVISFVRLKVVGLGTEMSSIDLCEKRWIS